MSTIVPGKTKEGETSALLLSSHVEKIAPSLSLTREQERDILESLGASAIVSKGEQRKEYILQSLHNALATRFIEIGNSSSLQPWQEAIDWNVSLLLNERETTDEGRLVYSFAQLLKLWRSTSPFTVLDGGDVPQMDLQTKSNQTVAMLYEHVQNFLSEQNIKEVTLYKALKWENNNNTIPLSEKRPEWYINPGSDPTEDGFDEQPYKKPIGARHILLTNLCGFTTSYDSALQLARYSDKGEKSNYYAVIGGTFPASSIVSIPTIGFGSLTRMEVVIDSRTIERGSFAIMFGRKSS